MKKRRKGRPKGSKNSDKLVKQLGNIDPEKAKLIKIIWKIQPSFKKLEIDLTKYSLEQLQKHIGFVKRKEIR